MSTPVQTSYIKDLATLKTKDFKEVKELVVSAQVVGTDATTVLQAETVDAMCDAMTDFQASKFIDALIATKTPDRSRVYAQKRVDNTVATLDSIKSTISNWDFST
jgi:predicted nucleotidyltransferase